MQVILRAHQLRRQRDAVAEELAELELSVAEAPGAPPPLAGAHAHLFTLANRVRETWAVAHATDLEPVLRRALERTSGRGSLRSIFEKDLETASWLRRLFPVMGCTLLSLGNVFPPEPGVVERVVVDEAGQCHPAYALAALMRAERALVIGDVNQLEPVVRLTAIDEQRVRRISDVAITDAELAPYRVHAENPGSAQRLADRAVKVRPQLRDHFRCQPAIIGLSDRLCGYHLAVHTPARSLVGQVPWLRDPVLLAAVEGQQVQARGSWANPQEADVVMELLRQLSLRGVPWGEVALLTPYVGQLDLLRQRLRQVGVPLESDREAWSASQPALFEAGSLATGTVHRFQGGERTLVIFSTVVGRDRSLGFLNARVNLVNVAVSRARDHLIIVGDPAVLARGPHTRVLTDRAVRLTLDHLR
ncbi:MAG: DEAD/DEAH box helicase [bacterium]